MVDPDWLHRATECKEFYTGERCYIRELHNCEQSPQVSLAIARVEPGVTTQLHALDGVAETYVLQQGSGVVEVNGQSKEVAVGDRVMIAPGVAQRISNTGTEDLTFYCICTPRFMPDCYVDLERDDTGR